MALNSNAYPNGFGESTGDLLVTVSPWYTGAFVRYVSSVLGNDSNTGLEKKLPKLTIGSAVTASSAGDVIVLAADHDETLTAKLTISLDGLVITAAGSSSGVPTAKLRINSAATNLILITGDNVEIRNILFPTAVQSNTESKIQIGDEALGSYALIKGCRFECALNDQGYAVRIHDAANAKVQGCDFVVTETTAGSTPANGLSVTDTAITRVVISDCTFDGGTVGFTSGYGLDTSASTIVGLLVEGVSLLNGADMAVKTASDGRINIATSTGSARVIFSA